MFHRPDLHRKEPTVFSVIPNPPKSVSEMSHNGTASYMVYDAHPPAKRMRKIRGKGHWKSKDLDFASDASAPSAASAASAFSSTGCSSDCGADQLHTASSGEDQSKKLCLTLPARSSYRTRTRQNQPAIEKPKEYEANSHRCDEVRAKSEETAANQHGGQSNRKHHLNAIAASNQAPHWRREDAAANIG